MKVTWKADFFSGNCGKFKLCGTYPNPFADSGYYNRKSFKTPEEARLFSLNVQYKDAVWVWKEFNVYGCTEQLNNIYKERQ